MRRKSMQRKQAKQKARNSIDKTLRQKQTPKADEAFPGTDVNGVPDEDVGMDGVEAFPGLDGDAVEEFPEPNPVGRGRAPSLPVFPNRMRLHSNPDETPTKRVNARRASTIISSIEMKAAVESSQPPKQPGYTKFSKLLSSLCDAIKEIRAQHSGFLANLKRFTELYVDRSLEAEDFVMVTAPDMPAPTPATDDIRQAVFRDSSYNTVKKYVIDTFGEAEFLHHKKLIQKLLRIGCSSTRRPPVPPPRSARPRLNSSGLSPSRSFSTPAFTAVKEVKHHHRSATTAAGLSQMADVVKQPPHQRNHSVLVTSSEVVASAAAIGGTSLIPPSRFGAQSDSEISQTWRTFSNTPGIATLFSNFKAVAISNQNFAAMLNSRLLPGQADMVVKAIQCSVHADIDYSNLSQVLTHSHHHGLALAIMCTRHTWAMLGACTHHVV